MPVTLYTHIIRNNNTLQWLSGPSVDLACCTAAWLGSPGFEISTCIKTSWASANCRFFGAFLKVTRPMLSAVKIKFPTVQSVLVRYSSCCQTGQWRVYMQKHPFTV